MDLFGLNTDKEKTNRMTAAYTIWRTQDTPLLPHTWKEAVSDQFADHPIGGVGVFVVQDSGTMVLKVLVGIKKYNSDPSNPSSKLLKHHFTYLGDVDGGMGEIVKVDWAMGDMTSNVNVYEERHHKRNSKTTLWLRFWNPSKTTTHKSKHCVFEIPCSFLFV